MSDTEGPEDCGRLLRRHRLDNGLTQSRLAAVSRVSVRTIRDIERGSCRRPRRETLRLMADGLGLAGRERAEFEAAVGGGAPGDGPGLPLAAEPVAPPAPVDALVGREAELAALTGTLAPGGQRLVTITGLGGVGKTRLALELAGALHRAEGLPVLWVSAADGPFPRAGRSAELSAALRAGLAALDRAAAGTATAGDTAPGDTAPGDTAPGDAAQLAAVVADQPALLVLDGYGPDRVRSGRLTWLLRSCPGLRVLATSGPPLGLPGERTFPLAPLAVPPHGAPDAGLLAVPAVRLLTRYIAQVRPDLRPGPADAGVLAALARCVDGIPAGLEAVASWLALYEPADLLAHLEAEPFEFLGAPPAGPGTPGLADLLDRVLDRLDPVERGMLTGLAGRDGPWSVADVVAATGRPTGQCARLVRRGLAYGLVAPHGAGRTRFRVLGLVARRLHAGATRPRSGDPATVRAGTSAPRPGALASRGR